MALHNIAPSTPVSFGHLWCWGPQPQPQLTSAFMWLPRKSRKSVQEIQRCRNEVEYVILLYILSFLLTLNKNKHVSQSEEILFFFLVLVILQCGLTHLSLHFVIVLCSVFHFCVFITVILNFWQYLHALADKLFSTTVSLVQLRNYVYFTQVALHSICHGSEKWSLTCY